jgi:hypothetical protein
MQVPLKKEGRQRHVQPGCTTGGVFKGQWAATHGGVSQVTESLDARLEVDVESAVPEWEGRCSLN